MTKTIEIIVSPQGETTIQTKGFAGASCRDASKQLEKALGIVRSDAPTAEMYQSQPITHAAQQKVGG